MSSLKAFEEKVVEYASNNITAMVGTIQITHNEKSDLKRLYQQLDGNDQEKAASFLKSKGIELGL